MTSAILNLEKLLPLKKLTITLRFTDDAKLNYFHQPTLTNYVKQLLGNPDGFENLLTLDTPESGQTAYQANDLYTFSVTALSGAESLLQQLIDALQRNTHLTTSNHSFAKNIALETLRDGMSNGIVNHADDLLAFDLKALSHDAAYWQSHKQAEWHWLSPVRLLKEKSLRQEDRGERRFCRNHSHLNAELLLNRVWDSLADLLRRNNYATPPRKTPQTFAIVEKGDAYWVNIQYCDSKQKGYTIGGLLGHTQWHFTQPLPLHWWQLLVLGQHTGIGQKRSLGLGRYQWTTSDVGDIYQRITAVKKQRQA